MRRVRHSHHRHARPGTPKGGDGVIGDLVEQSRSEDGTVRYRATADISEPNVVRFFEQYEGTEAAAQRTESEQSRRFVEALPDLVSSPLETIQFETGGVDVQEFDAFDAIEEIVRRAQAPIEFGHQPPGMTQLLTQRNEGTSDRENSERIGTIAEVRGEEIRLIEEAAEE